MLTSFPNSINRSSLARVVLIALSYLAVSTALATIPDKAVEYWYLYYSPVVIAALSFGLTGSLVGSGAALVSLLTFYVRSDAAVRQAGLAFVQQFDATSSSLALSAGQAVGSPAPVGVPNMVDMPILQDSFVHAMLGMALITLVGSLVGWFVDKNKLRYSTFQQEATIDALTGVPNYRRLTEFLGEQVVRSERYGHSFAYMMIDVDGLKSFNDRYGHRVGNAILAGVAQRLQTVLRGKVDMVARYGGDEFGVVLSQTNPDAIAAIGDRLRMAVSEPLAVERNVTAQVTISVGAAVFPTTGKSVNELVEAADTALYHSKLEGKNAVTVAQPPFPLQEPRDSV